MDGGLYLRAKPGDKCRNGVDVGLRRAEVHDAGTKREPSANQGVREK